VEIQLFPEPKGCVASYPVRTFYHPANEYKCANYLTFISISREYKSQNISRNLISTHDYNVRRHNPDVRIGLIKKEDGNCEGVVPILTFSTGLFQINVSKTKQRVRNIVEVYRQNWIILFDTLHGLFQPNVLYDFVVSIDIGAIQSRINGEILFVYAFCEKGNVLAMYFIEDAHTLYEKDEVDQKDEVEDVQKRALTKAPQKKGLRLAASINNGLTPDLFFQGFLECMRKLQKRNLDFKMLLVDNIGHNETIYQMMNNSVETNAGAYYFINWVFPHKVPREKAFILV
jgi:hypothetical protein